MFENKKIVVLMSTYNGEKYLREQLDSIYSQTLSHVTLVVRDDGSKDSTITILKKEEEKGCLKLIEGDNLGPGKSFWTLLEYASEFDFIAFADQDDFWLPDKLERAISLLHTFDFNETPLLYSSNTKVVDSNLNTIKDETKSEHSILSFDEAMIKGTRPGCTFVFNKKALLKINKFNIDNVISFHDAAINKIISLTGKVIIDYNGRILYRQHDNNVVGAGLEKKQSMIKSLKNIKIKKGKTAELTKELLNTYYDQIDLVSIEKLKIISEYKTSIFNKLKMYKKFKGIFKGKQKLRFLLSCLFKSI